MIAFRSKRHSSSFNLPIWPPLTIGIGLTIAFYGLIIAGPLDYYLIRRYCLCHEVAIITVGLFWICIAALTSKVIAITIQSRLMSSANESLTKLISENSNVENQDRAIWLNAHWHSVAPSLRESWFGRRITQLIARQTVRCNCDGLDDDLRELAHRDGDRLHVSYGMIRIAVWAMPMLGFLGTVIGIASTLGQIDSEMLASGSQEAMNCITAGLYVAFDKTAIALALTMATMFIQFGVHSTEQNLLAEIDSLASDTLMPFLSPGDASQLDTKSHQLLAELTDRLGHIVAESAAKQSEVLIRSLESSQNSWISVLHKHESALQDAHRQSSGAIASAEAMVRQSLLTAIDAALERHSERIAAKESVSLLRLDASRQHWESIIREHFQFVSEQQKEYCQRLDALQNVLSQTSEVVTLERSLNENIRSLTDVDRFQQTAICMTEAVAYLGTQLERVGALRVHHDAVAVPIRKRAA